MTVFNKLLSSFQEMLYASKSFGCPFNISVCVNLRFHQGYKWSMVETHHSTAAELFLRVREYMYDL